MRRDVAMTVLEGLIARQDERPKEYDEFLNFIGVTEQYIEGLGGISHLDHIQKHELTVKEGPLYRALSLAWKIYKYLR